MMTDAAGERRLTNSSLRDRISEWEAHELAVAGELDRVKAEVHRLLGDGETRSSISQRWQVATEAIDWLVEDRWPKISGVADRRWGVLAMIRESLWYAECGLVQAHPAGLATLECHWWQGDPRMIREVTTLARRAGVMIIPKDSRWSNTEIAGVKAHVLAGLDELGDVVVHDCLLQPEGLYFAVTRAPEELTVAELQEGFGAEVSGVPVFWGVAEQLRSFEIW